MSDRKANYTVVERNSKRIVLRDQGPWDQYLSITNAAESVVETEVLNGLGTRRLFYHDSEGELTELRVKDGKFAGFAPG